MLPPEGGRRCPTHDFITTPTEEVDRHARLSARADEVRAARDSRAAEEDIANADSVLDPDHPARRGRVCIVGWISQSGGAECGRAFGSALGGALHGAIGRSAFGGTVRGSGIA